MSISFPEHPEEAQHKIDRFVLRFEPSYRLLAYLAALPLALTPELLNYLRVQFLRGEVPWVAEVDLLLSDLCRQIGYELYAMDTAVRSCLLLEMEKQKGGKERMQEVAKLLISYVRYLGKTNTFLSHKELQAQQWSAMVYLDDHREDAVRQLAKEIKDAMEKVDKAELARLSRLTKELTPQLSDYPKLIDYANSISELIKNPDQVQSRLAKVFQEPTQVLDVRLPRPSKVFDILLEKEIPLSKDAKDLIKLEFEAFSEVLEMFFTYKELHDLLHQLEYKCYNGFLREARNFPHDYTCIGLLEFYGQNLKDIIADVEGIIAQKNPASERITWHQELNQALDFLNNAIENEDKNQLKKVIWYINTFAKSIKSFRGLSRVYSA